MLVYQFSRLAMWLMSQPFAHGDLKPDNILVTDNGTLVLVDYDGMFGLVLKSNTNNRAVFLPAAGWYVKDNLKGLEEAGVYWSRYNPDTSAANWAFIMSFGIGNFGEMDWLSLTGLNRYCGCTIRPVYVPQE